MASPSIKAVILDLDGVITQTARQHARAWKQMFDAYLEARSRQTGEHHEPFDIDADYARYIDGKLRYDGVRSFLASRGIELPEGSPDDGPDEETISGLGNRKNAYFHEILEGEGIEPFADAVEQIQRWNEAGLKLAVISSSRNCKAILEAAGLDKLFEVRVDGVESDRLDLEGKPAPDIFLEAARRLKVEPEEAIVVEDAQAGVEAGRRGGFGLVAGVSRDGGKDVLKAHGADIVVRDLREINLQAR